MSMTDMSVPKFKARILLLNPKRCTKYLDDCYDDYLNEKVSDNDITFKLYHYYVSLPCILYLYHDYVSLTRYFGVSK